jgi:hypothetical protein
MGYWDMQYWSAIFEKFMSQCPEREKLTALEAE